MRSSSVLINRAGLACFLAGLVLAGGCAAQRQAVVVHPAVQGVVNLDLLVRQHPGWGGVTRYDDALRRLNQAENQSPQAQPRTARATVAALAPNLQASSPVIPFALIQSEQSRLTRIQSAHLASLRTRRNQARRDQIARQEAVWQSESARLFPMPTSAQDIQPDLALQLQRLNVAQLTRTVQNWLLSPASAPGLALVQAKLARAEASLVQIEAQRAQRELAAQARYAEALTQVHQARDTYMQTQATQREITLRADDERLIAAQQVRLTEQRAALLQAAGAQTSALVPASGSLGAQSLPSGPEAARATLSQKSLAVAATHLRSQRARWIQFLYDDTRAAALDTARQRGWIVTYAPIRPGERDLTMPLTQALHAGVWRAVSSG